MPFLFNGFLRGQYKVAAGLCDNGLMMSKMSSEPQTDGVFYCKKADSNQVLTSLITTLKYRKKYNADIQYLEQTLQHKVVLQIA
jgi:hypothetical protein